MPQAMHQLAHDDVTDVIAGGFSSKHCVKPANCRQRAGEYLTLPPEAALFPVAGAALLSGAVILLLLSQEGKAAATGVRASRGLRPPKA